MPPAPAGCARTWAARRPPNRSRRAPTRRSGWPPCRTMAPRAASSAIAGPSHGRPGTMDPLARILNDYGLMILDGAMATELERRGCDLRDPLWSAKVLIEAPEMIKVVHAAYFAAGADCAITASYQATFQGFARRGLSEAEAADLMRLSVRLAVEARDEFWADPANRAGRPRPLVAASIGPYGAYLADGSEYRGDYGLSEEELCAFHRPRLAMLASSGADLLACETIPCLEEALALAELLSELPEAGAWISLSCRDEQHTNA